MLTQGEGKSKKLTEISQTVGYVWTQADALMSADHVKRIRGPT